MVDSTAESALAAHYRAVVGRGDDPQALVAGAKLFLDKGRADVAEHLYRSALARDSHNYWANMGLAQVCERDERFEEAVALYREALDGAQAPAEKTYAKTGLATALTGAGLLAQAEELFENIIEEAPDYVYAYTGLVFLYEIFPAPPWERIVSLCEQAVRLAPAEASWITPKLVNAQARVAYLARRVDGDSSADDLEVAQLRQGQDAFQIAVLFRRRKLAAILESQLRDHPLPYTLLIRQLFERVEAAGPGGFSSLPEFLRFAADFLAGRQAASATGKQQVDLPLAKRFYELSLAGKGKGLAAAHAGLLKLYLRMGLFDGAEAAVVRAVAEAGDDPAIVGAAAQLMQAMGRPAEARLLAGRMLELAPAPAAASAEGDVIDPVINSSEAWLNLQLVHDTANNAKVGKFGGVSEWLAAMYLKPDAKKRALPKDPAEIGLMTGWLGEFLSLLGDYSPALLLDLEHYRQHSGTWFKDLDDALLHYFEIGWKGRISTHAAFDASFVRRQLQEHRIDSSSEPPLLLFLRHEKALALSPNVLFDPAMYVKAFTEIPLHPWFHYLTGGWQQNPNVSPWFDMERFCNGVRRSPQDALLSPLMFYFTRDRLLDVNGLFHAVFYSSRYLESVGDSAPLAHYLSEGVFLGYQPNPFFQPQGMTAQQRLTYLKIKSVV